MTTWPGVLRAFREERPHPTPSRWRGLEFRTPEATQYAARDDSEARRQRAIVVAVVKRLGVPSQQGPTHWPDIVVAVNPPMSRRKVRRLWQVAVEKGEA
jgi:hypothetical protein